MGAANMWRGNQTVRMLGQIIIVSPASVAANSVMTLDFAGISGISALSLSVVEYLPTSGNNSGRGVST